jgi:hypothetical protein
MTQTTISKVLSCVPGPLPTALLAVLLGSGCWLGGLEATANLVEQDTTGCVPRCEQDPGHYSATLATCLNQCTEDEPTCAASCRDRVGCAGLLETTTGATQVDPNGRAPCPLGGADAPVGGAKEPPRAGQELPICMSCTADPDRDGWGWEGDQACRTGDDCAAYASCASCTSDPDRDGWGWENDQSCITGADCSNFPLCASCAADPDGDGWGDEAGTRCLVPTACVYPDCQSCSSDPDGDGWGWENEQSCKVPSTCKSA